MFHQPVFSQLPPNTDLSPELLDLLRKMLVKDPGERIKLEDIKTHSWVTGHGLYPMLKQESNCCLIEVTDDEVENSVKSIPKLDTLILVKVGIVNQTWKKWNNNLTGHDQEALLCKPIPEYSPKTR